MAITGVTDGGKGSFAAVAVPAGAALPTGVVPKWTSSDVTVATVDQSADPAGMTCVVTGITTGSVTLTVAATLSSGTIAQGSVVVPIIAGQVQSFTINQTA